MKKLLMRKSGMAAVIVLICGLVPLCAMGYLSQNIGTEDLTSSTVAYAAQGTDTKATEKTTDNVDGKKSTTDKSNEGKASKESANAGATSDKSASSKNSKEETTATGETAKAAKSSKDKKGSNNAKDAATMEGEFTFSEDADCVVCHTKEGESMTDSDMPASNHEALDCTTCHADVDELAKVHDGVAYGDKTSMRLKKTEVDTTGCETCHGDLEELAEITADCEILSDTNGTVVNPHALPENEDHATVDCSSCHSMHKDKPLETTAKKACKGCHHMDVYECNTCHD